MLPRLSLDAVLIEQVILNLLRNAIEAIAGRHGGLRRVEVATAAAEGAARETVRDSGPGLPAGGEGTIFDAFFTTKPEGLGLSVSRSIIEGSGGRLWAERNPDGGTMVGFALPFNTP
jgi:C4-dicarboxylate-specific signal transduction histidine kinase